MLTATLAAGESEREQPLALALEASAARFTLANSVLSLEARPGDIFFAGDSIRTSGGRFRFLSCADHAIFETAGTIEIRFETSAPKFTGDKPVPVSQNIDCALPLLPRSPDPNLQHGGVGEAAGERAGIDTPGFRQRIARLAPAFAAEMEPLLASVQLAPAETFRRLRVVRLLEIFGDGLAQLLLLREHAFERQVDVNVAGASSLMRVSVRSASGRRRRRICTSASSRPASKLGGVDAKARASGATRASSSCSKL